MSTEKKLLSAYFWIMLDKWGQRCIGIASTIILVRLIAPESFGVVALAMLCIGFFGALQNFNVDRYLIIQTELNQDLLNSGWTISIFSRAVYSLLLFTLANPLSIFFDESQLNLIIKVIAVNNFFSAFNNIGLVKYQKALNFKKISYLALVVKVFTTVITLIIAYFSPNHWALIIGNIAAVWLHLLGSYMICDYRPKLNFNFNWEMISFSLSLIVRNIFGYCRSKADAFIVSKLFDSASVGKYKIGMDFATLPLSEVVGPATGALFPAMAEYKHNKEMLFDKTYKYLALVYTFLLPCILGVWFVAPQFCTVILGEKWSDTAPIMAALGFLMLPFQIRIITNNLFDYLGKPRLAVLNDILGLSALCLFSATLVFEDVHQFVLIRTYIGLMVFIFVVILARITIALSIRKIIESMLPPIFATFSMYLVFSTLYFNDQMTLIGLVSNVLTGIMTYSISLLFFIGLCKPYSKIWLYWHDKIYTSPLNLLKKA